MTSRRHHFLRYGVCQEVWSSLHRKNQEHQCGRKSYPASNLPLDSSSRSVLGLVGCLSQPLTHFERAWTSLTLERPRFPKHYVDSSQSDFLQTPNHRHSHCTHSLHGIFLQAALPTWLTWFEKEALKLHWYSFLLPWARPLWSLSQRVLLHGDLTYWIKVSHQGTHRFRAWSGRTSHFLT